MTTRPRPSRNARRSAPQDRLGDGELRRVSILFADILNSTAMVQHLDPEAAAALLDPPLDAMRAAVNRFDGVVSHLGDGILAVFGAPSTCEDHAVRACLAALSMQDAMADMAPVRARIGIHTGDVVMRERRIGRAQIWEPVGPALSVAARIEQSAEPGTISVSATTAEQARGFVDAVPLPALIAKGFDEPLRLARLTAAEPGANRWTVRSANGLLDMVNRVEEQRALRAFLGGVYGPGPHVLQFYGEPGVGKSRLLHEALRTTDPDETFVVRLSGNPHRQDAAFHAFGIWLRGWLDIRAGDPPDTARSRLAERMRRVTDLTEAGRVSLERLLGLRASTASGVPEPDIAPGAVMALLRHGAGNRRLVLACEDLDCFDAASRDLLAAIVGGPGRDFLVVTTSRSRVRLSGPGVSQVVHLQPLSPADTMQLLCRIDERFAHRPDLAATLQDKTGGNPLFVEEVGAAAARALDHIAGGPAWEAEPEQLPDRVEALMADRLSRLPRTLRRLVQLCAVLGDTVPLRLLARLANADEAELHGQLLRLQSEHILTETRRYPDPEFAFRHGSMRETAYRTILAGRQRDLHDRARDILEGEDPGMSANYLDDLCFHAERAQNWAKAAAHMRQAAMLAVDKSAYQVARLRLHQALAALRKLPHTDEHTRQQLGILEEIPLLLRAAGRYAEVGAALDEAEILAARLGASGSLARIMVQRVHLLNIAGRMEEAASLGRTACEAAQALGDTALLTLASHNLAQVYYNQGRVRASSALLAGLAQTSDAAEPNPATSLPLLAHLPLLVHLTWAFGLAAAGEDEAARKVADKARTIAEVTGRDYDKAYAALAGGLARTRTDPAEAADLLLDGIAVCETGQIEQAAPALHSALGHLLLRSGDWAGAASSLQKSYRASVDQSRSMILCWAAAGLARARWELGDRDSAGTLAAEAVDVARRSGYRGYLAIALRLRAALLNRADAEASLREAEALADELGLSGELADCRAALEALGPGE